MKRAGFSLLEVMVALLIFALISTAAFGVLGNLLRAQEIGERRDEALARLQRTLTLSYHDVSQLTARSAGEEPLPAKEEGTLVFVRTGWRNPLGEPRSELATVRYEVVNGRLVRRLRPFAAAETAEPSLTQALMPVEGAIKVKAAVLRPTEDGAPARPDLLEITLTVPGTGEVRQLIPVPAP